MATDELDHLFDEIVIGSLALDNRLVMPPMVTRYASEDGHVTERSLQYYRERARGGTGLIVFESTYPCERHPRRHLLVDDSYVDGLSSVVDAVHAEGSKIAVQLNVHRASADELDPLAPSPLTTPAGKDVPAVDQERIDSLVESFAAGAERAARAGFDGIEIHAASGYLVHQFLSPLTNNRSDEYGGSVDGRTRFARELLAAAREAVDDDVPIWFRLSADEFLDGGYGVEGAQRIAGRLEAAGSAAFHVTAGHHWNYRHIVLSGYDDRGVHADLAAAVRRATAVPVIAVGRINDPVTADELIAEGKADLTAMGRAHLADPHIARKSREGNLERIRRCVGGLEGCRDMVDGSAVACTVNPRLGHEADIEDEPVDDPKEVVVVGGGPAGMEAARVAASRGHVVRLYERSDGLGGQLRWARHAPAKSEYDHLLQYYESKLQSTGVERNLGVEVDADKLASLDADTVVIATGSQPAVPNVEGVTTAIDAQTLVSPEDVMSQGKTPQAETAVVLGGTELGTDVAEFLSESDVSVSVVSEGVLIERRLTGKDKPLTPRGAILSRLEENPNIDLYEHATPVEFEAQALVFRIDDERRRVGFDIGVLATRESVRPVGLGQSDDIERVGDAERPADLFTAIHDGARVARSI